MNIDAVLFHAINMRPMVNRLEVKQRDKKQDCDTVMSTSFAMEYRYKKLVDVNRSLLFTLMNR